MILINSSTRQFNIPGADLVFGVTGDAGSAVKEFSCPRYVGNNLDLTGCFIRMNYRNANGEVDSYLVPEVAVDGDNVVFGWELSPKVTMYKGNVSFVMCVTGPDTKVAWHTTLGRGQVLEGLEPDSAMIEEGTADVVAALIAMVEAQTEAVENKGAEWVRNVQLEGTDQISAVQTAGKNAESDAVAEIEAKGVNTRNSIPEDYTAVQNAVDGLVRGKAPGIVCSAEGSAITVNDASDMAIQAMKIFGRSTQDGTPTPDAPVEIKSVEKPVVTVCGKNLFDGVIGSYAISQETVSAASAYVGFICPVAGGHTYTVSRDSVSSDRFRIAFTKIKPTSGTPYIGTSYSADTALSITAYAPEDATYLACYLSVTHEDVSGTHYQVELGDHATAYEPYEALQTVNLTHTLPGIPVTSGGNYTDSDGQQWICDEVDLERGVYVKRTHTRIIDGSGEIRVAEQGGHNRFQMRFEDAYVAGGNAEARCSHFYVNYYPLSDNGRDECITPYVKSPHIYLRFDQCATVEELTAWFAENPVTFIYVLATPIETALSETEIAAYRALHSNYPNTTVLNDAGAHMVVKYAADTKLYIDNKIAALIGG